jgi:WD40 repeat protein
VGLLLATVALGQEPRQRDIIRRFEDLESRPRLRIDVNGHTAAVRALAFTSDSKRLASAGLDKVVQIWNLGVVRDLTRVKLRERTIRWEVARGPRGNIFALALSPRDGLLAIGGCGTRGSTGDILLVHPVRGSLEQVLEGHRQTVCGLAFSRDGQWLASSDTDGRSLIWERNQWKPIKLYGPDTETYGAEIAGRIGGLPKLRPVAIVGERLLVLPVYVGEDQGASRWRLQQIRLDDRRQVRTFDTVHAGLVTALAASPDGSKFASADLAKNLYVWPADGSTPPRRLPARGVVLSLAFGPDGRQLAVGTMVDGQQSPALSELGVWDLERNRYEPKRRLPDNVYACAISADGKWLASCGGKEHEVFLDDLATGKNHVLRGPGRRVMKIAFAKERPFYRVAFSTSDTELPADGSEALDRSFDPGRSELRTGTRLREADWLDGQWARGDWSAQRGEDGGTLHLARAGALQGYVKLDPQVEGRIRCYCWIPDQRGQTVAIAVGTDLQNSIYLYRLVAQGACPILRAFRGQEDYITSIAVSRDLHYLASGSADGTICYWNLAGYQAGRAVASRWGVELNDSGDQLEVAKALEAGPLFRRGLRRGDVITAIRWPGDDGQVKVETRPAEIARRLEDLPWTTQVVFESARGGMQRPAFQLLPAWQAVATLFAGDDREWAFWTPEGYYDASDNGHTRFGWQINRGLHALPSFYRADQFRRKLERPQVMQRLLSAGSLEEAFRRVSAAAPAEGDSVVAEQIAVTPEIEIVDPLPGQTLRDNPSRVAARIVVPKSSKLVRTRLFANGVAASAARVISEKEVAGGQELTYEWNAALPADRRIMIQVLAGTDSQTASFGSALVEQEVHPPSRRPRLFVLALGINQYADQGIPPLDYSVADAHSIVDLLSRGARPIYDLAAPVMLTNEQVTRPQWRQTFADLTAQLKDVAKPDDLLLIFLAGHGVADEEQQKYYFITYDFKYENYRQGNYADCITWEDFEQLAAIPCRKLALLDTCHSGAIERLRQQNKLAVRGFQEDVVLTVCAASADELAEERPEWQHGVFTKNVLDALTGAAEQKQDRVITLDELVAYVRSAVPAQTDQNQHPTASPVELLPLVGLPLTQIPPTQIPASSAATAGR